MKFAVDKSYENGRRRFRNLARDPAKVASPSADVSIRQNVLDRRTANRTPNSNITFGRHHVRSTTQVFQCRIAS
jgi:hypothetical protein